MSLPLHTGRAAVAVALTLPLVGLAASGQTGAAAAAPLSAGSDLPTAAAGAAVGTGLVSGIVPVDRFTISSTVKINLNDQTVRLPLHRGTYRGTSVWYILTDASEQGPPTSSA